MKILKMLSIAALALMIWAPSAHASSFSVNWPNEYKIDTLNMWVVNTDDSKVDLLSAALTDKKGNTLNSWELATTSSMVFATGDPLKSSNKLYADLTFSDNTQSFAVEWAEIITSDDGEIKSQYTGTNYYTYENGRGRWTYTTGEITNTPTTKAPTPIPGAAWIMSSGLALLGGLRFSLSRKRS